MFGVDIDDEVVVGRDEAAVLQFEEDVGGGVVNGGNYPDGETVRRRHDGEANEGCQRQVVVGLFSECAWEIDVATGEFLCALLSVDVAELNEANGVVAETIFLHEKRYEDAVDVEHEIVGIDAVEDVVVELERHLAFDSVGLAQTANLVNFLWFDHIFF